METPMWKWWVETSCNHSSLQLFLCGKSSGKITPTWCHFTCSLKRENVGYCGKLFRERGSVLLAKREGVLNCLTSLKCQAALRAASSVFFLLFCLLPFLTCGKTQAIFPQVLKQVVHLSCFWQSTLPLLNVAWLISIYGAPLEIEEVLRGIPLLL